MLWGSRLRFRVQLFLSAECRMRSPWRIRMTTSRSVFVAVVTLLTAFAGRAQMQMVPNREPSSSPSNSYGQTRTYYIAADEVIWDYAPSGVNQITGKPFGEAESFWVASGPRQIGKVVIKAQYREYTDAMFTRLKPRS